MTFQSLEYGILLILVFTLYWFLTRRLQNLLLLGASYVFYSYVDPRMALLLGSYTLVNYFAARRIEDNPQHSKRYLLIAVAASLAALAFFKYAGFFVDNLSEVLDTVGLANFNSTLKIILPVGISFYTFQSLGYVIDVYMKRTHARKNFIDTALFIGFFPQLVAGPIERASSLLPQFERARKFNAERTAFGISLLAWGLFKKLVIADNVGMIVDNIFSTNQLGAAALWVGVLAFGIQILADFSGYTDIARGSARLFGIELSLNFRHPWLAKSPADFWRRWHITLSTWLRDYVYIPLGGNRQGRASTVVNVVITFVLGGLWHGGAWNFVLWGLLHATFLLIWRGARALNIKSNPLVSATLTFTVISASWLLFREGDFSFIGNNIFAKSNDLQLAAALAATALLYSIPLWLHAIIDQPRFEQIWTRNDVSRTIALTALTLTSFIGILLLRADLSAEFIYFRF
ncbi:MAG TPA: MBOAT family protein [Dehalococcoidia bacterium]|jgi:D-alanyl-lipoteichoic acid acyltransferase DltB (MBOAT superfamily)|nr:MBOAT family protein [Dehalococcoidia bacterium]HIK90220.1 MBOAT family protein [Dehalococcoidia bacterium]